MQSKKQKSSRSSDDNQETLSTILSTLKDLKSDINSRIANLENNYTPNGDSESLKEDQDLETLERERDTISVLAGNDFDRSNWDHATRRFGFAATSFGYSTTKSGYSATKPGYSANKFGVSAFNVNT